MKVDFNQVIENNLLLWITNIITKKSRVRSK